MTELSPARIGLAHPLAGGANVSRGESNWRRTESSRGRTPMVRRFGRVGRPVLAGILALALLCPRAPADEGRGIYVGVFGGGGCSTISNVTQLGTALLPPTSGGPLAVHATGGSGT